LEPHASAGAEAFIRALVCDVNERLDFADILAHPFFGGLDISKIRELPPPYIPRIKSGEDTSHFGDVEVTNAMNRSSMASLRSGKMACVKSL